MERPKILENFPPVIAVNAEGLLASSIDEFTDAMAAANANASAGVATDVEQAVQKESSNVLINIVSMQDCFFDECTNLAAMVGQKGCSRTGDTADCKEYCRKVHEKDDKANCVCPEASTCGESVLHTKWNADCKKRGNDTCSVPVKVTNYKGTTTEKGACEWGTVSGCLKKKDCSVTTVNDVTTGTGCGLPPLTEAFFKKNQMRACWGVDSDKHRGCVHGDISDPTAPTVVMGCLGLCTRGPGICSDGKSRIESSCTKKKHTWNAKTKLCSNGASTDKATCTQQTHSWTPGCSSADDTVELAKNPTAGTPEYRRMILCQDWVNKYYPYDAVRGTGDDTHLLDYYDSLMLARNPTEVCGRAKTSGDCKKNGRTCTWKVAYGCVKNPEFAASVLTSVCDTIDSTFACNEHPDCKFNSARMECEVDANILEGKRKNIKERIDAKVDANTREFCYNNVRIDNRRSGHKRVCKRMFGSEDVTDAQECPEGYSNLPVDAYGFVHDSPNCDEGGECKKCSTDDPLLCQKLTDDSACTNKHPGVCTWKETEEHCFDIPCEKRDSNDCKTNCVWNSQNGVCEDCIIAKNQNMASSYDETKRQNPVKALSPLFSTKMTYGGQCVIKNIVQSNEINETNKNEQRKKIDNSLRTMDLAAIRQAMRGVGAATLGGFNADKFTEAQNIAKQTQNATVAITNEVLQECGDETSVAMLNLAGQSCVNTRRCVIDGVKQTNTLDTMASCVQNVDIKNEVMLGLQQKISQLSVIGNSGLRTALIDTVVWSVVLAGPLAALAAWTVGGPSSGAVVVVLGAAVVAGIGLQLWLPSRKKLNREGDEYLMHGSVARRPGKVTSTNGGINYVYNPLPAACGMEPIRELTENGITRRDAETTCRNAADCNTFYFNKANDPSDAGQDCPNENNATCTNNPACMLTEVNTWVDRWYGFVDTTGGNTIHLLHAVEELDDLWTNGVQLKVKAGEVVANVTNVSGKDVTVDAPVKGLTYGTRVTFQGSRQDVGQDVGLCSNTSYGTKEECLKAKTCSAGPPTSKFSSKCELSITCSDPNYTTKESCEKNEGVWAVNRVQCAAECANEPYDDTGKLKKVCERCCRCKKIQQNGQWVDDPGCGECQTYVDFVGGRRTLRCSSCMERKGMAWFYNENAGAKHVCSDPSFSTREECEEADHAWARCIAGIDQPHLVTGDQLQCFDRVPRWLGYGVPKFPYAKAGKELAVEATVWGASVVLAMGLVQVFCSNVPKLNGALGLDFGVDTPSIVLIVSGAVVLMLLAGTIKSSGASKVKN